VLVQCPPHHSGAQGQDFAGRERSGGSGAIAAAGGCCSFNVFKLLCSIIVKTEFFNLKSSERDASMETGRIEKAI
jgi:hypothetical protein